MLNEEKIFNIFIFKFFLFFILKLKNTVFKNQNLEGGKKFMLKKLIIFYLFLCFYYCSIAYSETTEKFDYFFVVDCSGSMVGLPKGSGNAIIFPQVKEAINSFIDNIGDGATVTIFPFHKNVQGEFSREITSNKDRQDLKDYINNLKAEGQVTWIYYSLRAALDKAKQLRDMDKSKHNQVILLYTDGADNGPQDLTLDGILEYFKLQRGENEFLYLKYITLGLDLKPYEEEVIKKTEGVELIKNPKGELPKKFIVEVKPYMLNFGNFLEKEENSRNLVLKFDPTIKSKEIKINILFEELDSLGVGYVLIPERTALDNTIVLTLKLINRETLLNLPAKIYEGKLSFIGDSDLIITPPEIKVSFTVEPKKTISISAKDGKKLYKDFGKIKFTSKENFYAKEWPFVVTFNDYAIEGQKKLNIQIRNDKNNPQFFTSDLVFFKIEENIEGEHTTIDKNAEVNLTLNIPKDALKKGIYKGFIVFSADKDVYLEGEGLEVSQDNPEEYLAKFSFEIIPPPFPWIPFLIGIIVFLAIMLRLFANPGFAKGAKLEDSSIPAKLTPLNKKFAKWTYSVSGSNADFIMGSLPSNYVFKIKPEGKFIRVIPHEGSLYKNGEQITSAGVIMGPGDHIEISEGQNSLKIFYKISEEEV